ncbi:hypothetical protein FACS1894169_10480 [Bacteroidia bacterium]|nr:hypothetical protein FACS1894169_10480 [Bacteroidia bacterium]
MMEEKDREMRMDDEVVTTTSLRYEQSEKKGPILARIISFVLTPLLMVVYVITFIFIYTDFKFLYGNQFIQFIAPAFFLSCAIPVSGIYTLKVTKLITDYKFRKGERFLPFTIFFFSYGLLFYYFFSAKLTIWFLAVLAVPMMLLIIYALVLMFWKISVYMLGIGGLIGSIMSICYNIKGLNLSVLFIILFILAGSLGVSRLTLNRNTPAQVYAGFLIGIVVSYFTVWIGAYWGIVIFLKNL